MTRKEVGEKGGKRLLFFPSALSIYMQKSIYMQFSSGKQEKIARKTEIVQRFF